MTDRDDLIKRGHRFIEQHAHNRPPLIGAPENAHRLIRDLIHHLEQQDGQ
jgi:hypothetical protein